MKFLNESDEISAAGGQKAAGETDKHMNKVKNSGLGRGLDSIFLDNSVEEKQNVTMLRVSQIEPNPNQPRKQFAMEPLSQLADSIAAHGLIQPIVVRNATEDGYFQIIAGERRWRASKMAGLSEVPAIVMDADDKKASELSLIENIQRENLNVIEEASALSILLESYQMTQEELSKAVGKSRSALANVIRLLDLPDEVVVMVKEDRLSAGHARALLGLKNPDRIVETARLVEKKGVSVRAAEELVRLCNKQDADSAKAEEPEKPLEINYTDELARKMTTRLGRDVRIKNAGKNRRLEICFENDEDLDSIVKLLCGENIFDE